MMLPAPATVISFAVALGAGLLIGTERERRKGVGARRALAGVRTFTLTSLAGALAQALQQPSLVAAGAGLTVVLIAIAYYRDRSSDPGVTTEVALFITFLIGVTTVDAPVFAGGAAVVVASLLAMRSRLHHFSTKVLTTQELHDALLLAGAAMVVLPLVPNQSTVWLAGANPRRLWGLVVLILALQGAGYIALRVAGARLGLALSGLASGFVSSTATIAAMGSRARTHPRLHLACVAGALFSSLATYLQVGLIAFTLHPPSLAVLATPLAVGALIALLSAGSALRRQTESGDGTGGPGQAFNIPNALGFATLLTTVTVAVSFARSHLGIKAAALGAALAGLADAHAAAGSALSMAANGQIDAGGVVFLVLLGLATNTLTRSLIAFTSGGVAYGWRVSLGLLGATLGAWAAAWYRQT
jgi:uncharacterized membrane protein (DUF4010 family)